MGEIKNKKDPEPQIIYKERLIHDKCTQVIEDKILVAPLTPSNIQVIFLIFFIFELFV